MGENETMRARARPDELINLRRRHRSNMQTVADVDVLIARNAAMCRNVWQQFV